MSGNNNYAFGETSFPITLSSLNPQGDAFGQFSYFETVGSTPAGWSHDLNGVANATISKVNGVSLSSVAKINGVS